MPTPWHKGIRNTGRLTVCNKAVARAPSVISAIGTFNSLGFEVKLVEDDKRSQRISL